MADAPPQVGSKPTPTQAENDAAARGEHVMVKEADGSPEEPSAIMMTEGVEVPFKKQAEADKPAATYSTRQVRAKSE